MIIKKLFSIFLSLVLWGPVIFFSALLSHNAVLYFTHGGEYGILPEKLLARQDWLWNACFYIHLPAGVLCLLSPLLLFSRLYYKGKLKIHQLIGKMYVWVTLLIVCPTGMYLALYAKGGFITQVGFMVQGILLLIFTWLGYKAIQTGNKSLHIAYMIRSYAMVLVVLSFRILHIAFFIWAVPYEQNYAISQWLGMAANALVAEMIITRFSSIQSNSIKPVTL